MTKIQKQKHIDAIHQLVESSGYIANHWGKYHRGDIKIDIADNNIKIWRGERKIWSKTMTALTLEEISARINSL